MLTTLRRRYQSLPPTVRASLLFTASGVLQKGVAVLVVPLYTRMMPAADYGRYSIFSSWYQLIMIVATLNMWNYLINNGITEFGGRRWDFVAALQGLSTAITLACLVAYVPLAGVWEGATGLTPAMMLLMFGELLFMPSFEYWCAVKRYDYEARGVVAASLLIAVATPLVSIPAISAAPDKGLAAIACKCGVSTAVYAAVAVRMLMRNHRLFDAGYWRYALGFNLPLVPHFLSMMALTSSDRIMIERMCGPADAAMYSVAYQAAAALQLLNSSILSSFVPYTYQAISAGRAGVVGRRAVPLAALIGGVNLLAALFAPEMVAVLAPESYRSAIYVVPPVAMSNLFMFMFNLFANIEYYYKQTRLVAAASMIAAAANVALNLAFIPAFGFVAAGYTTLACYVLFSACHYAFMRRVYREHMGGTRVYDMSVFLPMLAAFTFAALLVGLLYRDCLAQVRYVLALGAAVAVVLKRDKVVSLVRGRVGEDD